MASSSLQEQSHGNGSTPSSAAIQNDPGNGSTDTEARNSLSQDQLLWYTEREELQAYIRSLEDERLNLKRELADTRVELKETLSSLQTAEGLAAAANGNTPKAANQSFHSSSEVAELEQELAAQKAKETDLRKKLIEARETAASSRQRLDITEQQLEYLQQDLALEREQRHEEQGTSESRQAAIQDPLTLLQDQRNDLAKKVQQLLEINGDLRSTSANLRLQLEQREDHILKLEESIATLKKEQKVGEVLLERQMLEWKSRATEMEVEVKSLQMELEQGRKRAHREPSTISVNPVLAEKLEGLEVENERLLQKQKNLEEDFGHQRNLLKRNVQSLETKVHELEQESLASGSRDGPLQPPSSIVDDHTVSSVNNRSIDYSVLSVTSNPTTPSRDEVSGRARGLSMAMSPQELFDRAQKAEEMLLHKVANEAALAAQVNELSMSTKKARREAERSKEQVELLQTYLDVSLTASIPSKEKALQESIVQSMANLEKKQDQQEREREQAEHLQQRLVEEKAKLSARQKARLERVKGLEETLTNESQRVSMSLEESYNASSRFMDVQEHEDGINNASVGGVSTNGMNLSKDAAQTPSRLEARLAEIARKKSKLQKVRDDRQADDDRSVNSTPAQLPAITPVKMQPALDEEMTAAKEQLETELTMAKEEIDRLQKEIDHSKIKLEEVEQNAKAEAKKLKQKYKKEAERAEHAKMELDTANAWVSDLRFQLKEQAEIKKEEIDGMKQEIDKVNLTNKSQKRALDAANKKLAALQDECDEKEEALEEAEEELKTLRQANESFMASVNGKSVGDMVFSSDMDALQQHNSMNLASESFMASANGKSVGDMVFSSDMNALQQQDSMNLAAVQVEKEDLAEALLAASNEAEDARMELADSIEVQKLLRLELKSSRSEIDQLKEEISTIEKEKASAFRIKQNMERLHQTETQRLIRSIKESDSMQAELEQQLSAAHLEVESYRARISKLEKKINELECGPSEPTVRVEPLEGSSTIHDQQEESQDNSAMAHSAMSQEEDIEGEDDQKLVESQGSNSSSAHIIAGNSLPFESDASGDSKTAETDNAQVLAPQVPRLSKEFFTSNANEAPDSDSSEENNETPVVAQAPRFSAEFFTGGVSLSSDSDSSSSSAEAEKTSPVPRQIPKFSADFFTGGASSSSDSETSSDSNSEKQKSNVASIKPQAPKFSSDFFTGKESLSSDSDSSSSVEADKASPVQRQVPKFSADFFAGGASSSSDSETSSDSDSEKQKSNVASIKPQAPNFLSDFFTGKESLSSDSSDDSWSAPNIDDMTKESVVYIEHYPSGNKATLDEHNGRWDLPLYTVVAPTKQSTEFEEAALTLMDSLVEEESVNWEEEARLLRIGHENFRSTLLNADLYSILRQDDIEVLQSNVACLLRLVDATAKETELSSESLRSQGRDGGCEAQMDNASLGRLRGESESHEEARQLLVDQGFLLDDYASTVSTELASAEQSHAEKEWLREQDALMATDELAIHEDFAQTIPEMKALVAKQQNRLESASSQMNDLEREIMELTDERLGYETTSKKQQGRLESARDQLNHMEAQIAILENDKENLQDEKDVLHSRLDQCEGQLREANTEISELRAHLTLVEEKPLTERGLRSGDEVSLVAMEKRELAALAEAKRAKEELDAALAEADERYWQNEDRITSYRNDLDDARAECEKLKAEIERATAELKESNRVKALVVNDLDAAQEEIKKLKEEASQPSVSDSVSLLEERDELKNQLQKQASRLDGAAIQLNELEEMMQIVVQERDTIATERDHLLEQVETQGKRLEGASKQLSDMEDSMLAFEEELETCQLHNKALEGRLHTMKLEKLESSPGRNSSRTIPSSGSRGFATANVEDVNTGSSFTREKENLESRLASYDSKLKEAEERVRELACKKEAEEASNSKLTARIDDLEATIALLETNKQGLENQIESVESILQSKLGDLQTTKDKMVAFVQRHETDNGPQDKPNDMVQRQEILQIDKMMGRDLSPHLVSQLGQASGITSEIGQLFSRVAQIYSIECNRNKDAGVKNQGHLATISSLQSQIHGLQDAIKVLERSNQDAKIELLDAEAGAQDTLSIFGCFSTRIQELEPVEADVALKGISTPFLSAKDRQEDSPFKSSLPRDNVIEVQESKRSLLGTEVANIHEANRKLKEERDFFEEQYSGIQDSLSIMSTMLMESNQKLKGAEAEFEERHSLTKAALNETSRELEDVLEAKRESSRELETALRSIEELNSKLSDQLTLLDNKEREKEDYVGRIEELQKELDLYKEMVKNSADEVETSAIKITTFQRELDQLELNRMDTLNQISGLEMALQRCQARNTRFEKEVALLHQRNDELLNIQEGFVKEKGVLSSNLEEVILTNALQESTISELKSERDLLLTNEEKRREEINALVAASKRLHEEMEDMRIDLSGKLHLALDQNAILEARCSAALETLESVRVEEEDASLREDFVLSEMLATEMGMPVQHSDEMQRVIDKIMKDLEGVHEIRVNRTMDLEGQRQELEAKVQFLENQRNDLNHKCKSMEDELERCKADIELLNDRLAAQQSLIDKGDSELREEVEQLIREKAIAECDLAIFSGELDVLRAASSMESDLSPTDVPPNAFSFDPHVV